MSAANPRSGGDCQAAVTARPRSVYVIDDDSMIRRALFFALESAGFSPRSFRSGRDFLDEIDQLAEGVILLDLRMPDLDGLEVLTRLGRRITRFPVVMITGHGEIPAAVSAMKMGAIDFIEKPFAEEELFEILEGAFAALPDAAREEERRRKASDLFQRLTPREVEVVQCLVDGLSNKLIASRLGISPRTVEVHRANLMDRLELGSLAEVVRMALESGMKPTMESRSA
jgi:two-component system, LuxR family, response regulator FixJ